MIDHDFINNTVMSLLRQKEEIIMKEFNELVSKGLLVVEQTEMKLFQHPMKNEIKMEQGVRLVLKDQEYIEKLEEENKELKEKLEKINEALS